MTEEKKEKWLNYLALSTIIFAVCATLSTFKGGSHSTRSVLSQSQASDQWAYFQSKSIKGYLYELQKEKFELELKAADPRTKKLLGEDYEKRIGAYAGKIRKYDEEKVTIQNDAKALEAQRDDAQRHSKAFGMAVIFLQIAILLSSIAALLKKRIVWLTGLLCGVFGLVYFANGFWLFMP
ncbi:MAG: DUF4337 domain-containing protein [Nitrospirae bacterium]|nr:MAG: DUF4337 domain-containing protein [Nitrospirota bacterium]